MSQAGSCDRTAEIAARAFLDLGCSRLKQKIGAHVASFGANCFQTDAQVRNALAAEGGHVYHRGSIGRARRQLTVAGLLRVKRVFMGHKPQGARETSAHGTTSKWIRWDALGVPDPTVRRDAAIDRATRRKAKRIEIAKQIEQAARAKHSAPPPEYNYATRTPDADPALAAVLQRFERLQSERVQRSTPPDEVGQKMTDHGPGPPPDH